MGYFPSVCAMIEGVYFKEERKVKGQINSERERERERFYVGIVFM